MLSQFSVVGFNQWQITAQQNPYDDEEDSYQIFCLRGGTNFQD